MQQDDAQHVPHSFVESCLESVGFTIVSVDERGTSFLVGFEDTEGFVGAIGRPPGRRRGLVFSCGLELPSRGRQYSEGLSDMASSAIVQALRAMGLKSVVEPATGPPRRIQILAELRPDETVDGGAILETVEKLRAGVSCCLATLEGFRVAE